MDIKEVQQIVFKKLISNPKTLPSFLNKVSPEDFSCVPLAREVTAAFNHNGNAVHYSGTKENFEILLRDRPLFQQDKQKLDNAVRVLSQLAASAEDQKDLDLLIKEMRNDRMARELGRIIGNTANDIANYGPAQIEKVYDGLLRQILALPFGSAQGVAAGQLTEAFADVEQRIAMYFKEEQRKFKTGMSAFDDQTGGLAPGEFLTLMAGTGQGKSAVMLWMAEQFLKNGANVIYVTIEMSYQEVMERYHAMTSGLDLRDIRNKKLSEEQLARYFESIVGSGKADKTEFMREAKQRLLMDRLNPQKTIELGKTFKDRAEKFFVLDIPKNCTPSRIEREISRLAVDTPIHVCLIDYLNIMEPNFHSKDKVREQQAMAQDLKGVFRKLGIIGIAGCQMNTAEIKEGDKLTTDNTRYSKAISENCDWQLAFARNENDDLMKQVKIHLVKHRHCAPVTILLETDFDRMQFKDLGRWDESMAPAPQNATQPQEGQRERYGATY